MRGAPLQLQRQARRSAIRWRHLPANKTGGRWRHGRLVKLFLVAGISLVAVWRLSRVLDSRRRGPPPVDWGAAAVLSMRFVPIPQWKCLLAADSIQVQLHRGKMTLHVVQNSSFPLRLEVQAESPGVQKVSKGAVFFSP